MKLLLKNPITLWIFWLIHYFFVKKIYSTAKLCYHAFARDTILGKYTTLYDNVNLRQCTVGDYTYVSHGSLFFNTKIGNYCSVGPGVLCGLGKHPTTFISTHPIFFSTAKQAQITFSDKSYFEETLPIQIGHDVWIGANVIILDGVKIGNGAIIAAGAVVNKDVPDYAVVGGVPAKIIKFRFSQNEIDFLLQFKWWDKDDIWVRENWKSFHNMSDFLKANS